MQCLSRAEILGADDLPREFVMVPEWGGGVYVRTLTGTDRDSFEVAAIASRGEDSAVNLRNIRAKLVALSVETEAGARMFAEADVAALGAKSARALDRIFAVAQRLSGLTKEDANALGKPSAPTRSGDSVSG